MSCWPPFIDTRDLAPGDTKPHPALPEGLRLHVVKCPQDPYFETAYTLLEEEFGHRNELETRKLLTERMRWNPAIAHKGFHMLYSLLLLLNEEGQCVAIRDHSAITPANGGEVIVHLSHVLVVPQFRRMGLAALLRTLPVATARECARAAGDPNRPITLACEMEPHTPGLMESIVRRTSYQRASFRNIGSEHGYLQPDFRPEEIISQDPYGPRPVLFDLLLRRVGRENETKISGSDVISAAEMLYAMYARSFSERVMAPCQSWLETFRKNAPASIPLRLPAEG